MLTTYVTTKDHETLDAIYTQSRRDVFGNIMCKLPWYLGGAFERDEMNNVMKMTQIAFVDLWLTVSIYKLRSRLPRPFSFTLDQNDLTKMRAISFFKQQAVDGLMWTFAST